MLNEVRYQSHVRVRVRFMSDSGPVRVRFVSGFVSGSCPVRVWDGGWVSVRVRVGCATRFWSGFVSGSCLVRVWSCLVRVRFVSGIVFGFVSDSIGFVSASYLIRISFICFICVS